MTGVIRSNRCGTCRTRKVKCDEAKPVCGPCAKGNRACKDTISRYKFTEPKAASATPQSEARSRKTLEPCTEIAVLSSAETEDGGSFQTMRFSRPKRKPAKLPLGDPVRQSPLPRHPSFSTIETLQLTLAESFTYRSPGLRLSVIANYIIEIPPRIGHSVALDDAINCLVNCYTLVCHGSPPGLDPKQARLYTMALFSLQRALADPIESYSDNTLGAVTILGHVEVYGGGAQDARPNYIQHAGGAVKMVQVLGPKYFRSKFAKLLYVHSRQLSIAVATVRGEECFLHTPEWREISCTELIRSPTAWISDQLGRWMTAFPSLVKKVRHCLASPEDMDPIVILRDAQQLRRGFQEIAEFVEESMRNGIDVIKLPSAHSDLMTPIIYQYATRDLASICVNFWGFSIVLDTIMAKFMPPDSPPSVFENLRNRIISARLHIYMSYEYSEQFRPLGTQYMSAPLIMAYFGATNEEKIWSMHKLWDIGELVPRSKYIWGPVALEFISRYFIGEPVHVASGVMDQPNSYEVAFNENMRRFADHAVQE
ncbi:hypothetical protein K458DRAFT_433193 [Lentithecium fluviatile CBS 122367]|uniref:Zn(2)-C6 fungal-type domain-containing protein n=1 Tax=Lentithecium fluviatile CBS 122367 TaxID=1168545 RepID=A0A6G1IVF4_9PLEO|nr:hypothetical protein K458DRAFT_433193 [Lentithecium fluviatile CBS 122367]